MPRAIVVYGHGFVPEVNKLVHGNHGVRLDVPSIKRDALCLIAVEVRFEADKGLRIFGGPLEELSIGKELFIGVI